MSAQTIFFPLESAFLCCDCHMVGNSAVRCPACASEHGMLGLASALARPDDSVRLAGIARAVNALEAAFVLSDLDADVLVSPQYLNDRGHRRSA